MNELLNKWIRSKKNFSENRHFEKEEGSSPRKRKKKEKKRYSKRDYKKNNIKYFSTSFWIKIHSRNNKSKWIKFFMPPYTSIIVMNEVWKLTFMDEFMREKFLDWRMGKKRILIRNKFDEGKKEGEKVFFSVKRWKIIFLYCNIFFRKSEN